MRGKSIIASIMMLFILCGQMFAQDRFEGLGKQSLDNHQPHKKSFKERIRDHWDDYYDAEGYGGSVSYTPDQTFGLSAHLYNDWFHISMDVEVPFDSPQYSYRKKDKLFQDHFNLMFSPGVNFFYCTFDVGLGIIAWDKVTHKSLSSETSSSSGDGFETSTSTSVSLSYDSYKVLFHMRPRLTIHVPLQWNFDGPTIDLSVGYNIVPSLKDYPALTLGVGFTYFL